MSKEHTLEELKEMNLALAAELKQFQEIGKRISSALIQVCSEQQKITFKEMNEETARLAKLIITRLNHETDQNCWLSLAASLMAAAGGSWALESLLERRRQNGS